MKDQQRPPQLTGSMGRADLLNEELSAKGDAGNIALLAYIFSAVKV